MDEKIRIALDKLSKRIDSKANACVVDDHTRQIENVEAAGSQATSAVKHRVNELEDQVRRLENDVRDLERSKANEKHDHSGY